MKPRNEPAFCRDELFEPESVHPGRRDVTAQAVDRQHRERKQNTVPEIRNPEDIGDGFEELVHEVVTSWLACDLADEHWPYRRLPQSSGGLRLEKMWAVT